MHRQAWQVGLDIQTNTVRAIAIQPRRGGWQLRHWWQEHFSQPILHDGSLQQPKLLIDSLRQWRSCLPRHISLRIALPVQKILQQQLPAPDARLCEPERSWFIDASLNKPFPLERAALALDYRVQPDKQLRVTAAHQQELQLWLGCLQQADLSPAAVDIAPCALRIMARAAGLSEEADFLHQLDDHWLWVAPLNGPFAFHLLAALPYEQPAQVRLRLQQAGVLLASTTYFSSVFDPLAITSMLSWSPLSAFARLYPPLPTQDSAFVLAGGLALRQEDQDVSG